MTTRQDLSAHLDELAREGHFAPCQINRTAGWVSELPTAQRAAAALCTPCAALAVCRSYGLDNPLEWGVLGGLVNSERHRTTKPKDAI